MFYDNLRAVCAEKGTTVTTVLKELHMSTGSTGKWKEGSIPKIDTVIQLAEHLDEKPPLFPLGGARSSLFDKSVHYLPALPEFRSHLVDLLLLASERGEGNRFNAHAPQMLKNLGKRSPAFRKKAVHFLQNLRRQPAE